MSFSTPELQKGLRKYGDEGPPYVLELRPAPDILHVFRRFSNQPHCLFLDSALRRHEIGRYSFVTADPFFWHSLPANQLRQDEPDKLASLQHWPVILPEGVQHACSLQSLLAPLQTDRAIDLPPFQGGLAGLFSYDLNRSLERIAAPRVDEFQVPALAIGLYDWVISFDHEQHRCWLVSQGFPETDPRNRRQRALDRAECVLRTLHQGAAETTDRSGDSFRKLAASELAPQYPTTMYALAGDPELTSNFAAEAYLNAVQQGIDYIRAGDIFQVNLAQRLLHPAVDDDVSLYLRLRNRNPATFSAYFDLGEFRILSASPERFLSIRDGHVQTRPIKGTRQRIARAEADLFVADELRRSEKDRAENVMIVDLLRNDLSRVCRPDSVHVSQLCGIERYEFVQHLVSVVHGELEPGLSPISAIAAAFPGGSITGAPKVRAMEIIQELEPTARGPYCGSLGYIGFDGTTDLNILIRTIISGRGWWQMPVGGGIVAQSHPPNEYEETWHKARGLLRALK